MNDTVNTIINAASRLQLNADALALCDPQDSNNIVANAMSRFVHGRPRVWWLSFKGNIIVRQFAEASDPEDLYALVPESVERVWFIPESETQDYSVFDATVKGVVSVLKECPFFEYYLLEKEMNWLLAENDHNEVLYVKYNEITPHRTEVTR